MTSCIKEQPLPMTAKKNFLSVQFTTEEEHFASFPTPAEEEKPGGSHPEKRKAGLGRIFELLSLYK